MHYAEDIDKSINKGSQSLVWQVMAWKGKVREQGYEARGAISAQGYLNHGVGGVQSWVHPAPCLSWGCSQQPWASCFPFHHHCWKVRGEKDLRYQQKGRNHHLKFIVLSSESCSVPQFADLQTCSDAAYLPHWSAAKLSSLVFVAYFKTLNWNVLKKWNTLGTKHVDIIDDHTKYASIKAEQFTKRK